MSSWRSSPTSERLAAARVLGAKGLAGGMRLEVLTDRPDRLSVGSLLFAEGEAAPRRIIEAETGGRHRVIRLEGVDRREQAAALHGRYLEVDLEPLPEGSYYWHQIVGLKVADEDGRQLGAVVEVFRAGENEVYRVESEGQPDLLLPALREVIRHIDLHAGSMIVRYESEEVR
ncbi:MAG TPA: ribosome maturation factor RimM [Candidatus Limnocylindrales bacterium]|nr:ribosome maturation factor RimM [Candidatus Limnocylindrales bacterium]